MKKVVDRFFNSNLSGKNKKYNDIKLLEIVISALFIIFGIILFMNKTVGNSFMAVFLGIIILLKAILNIYSFIMLKSNSLFKMNIVFGMLYFIVSILLFTNFIKFLNYLPIYFGTFLIIEGLKELVTAIKLKLIGEDTFFIILAMSILIITLGGLMIFYPFTSFTILDIISIFSILYGILIINDSNLLRNRVDKFLSKVDND